MPTIKIPPDSELFYRIDDFTDPWSKPESILFLHGNSESGSAWYGWIPHLSRDFRLVRPDMRGFGESTPMPRDFPWTLDTLVNDFILLMDTLGIARFHVVGAKIGGKLARVLAATHPERVSTLTVVGSRGPSRSESREEIAALMESFDRDGIEAWARRTMQQRLGSGFPAAGADWWAKYMGRTSLSSQVGFIPAIAYADISAHIPRIKCPTLAITTSQNPSSSVEQTREWQSSIPGSELVVLRNDSFHPAITNPEESAQATRAFIMKHPEH